MTLPPRNCSNLFPLVNSKPLPVYRSRIKRTVNSISADISSAGTKNRSSIIDTLFPLVFCILLHGRISSTGPSLPVTSSQLSIPLLKPSRSNSRLLIRILLLCFYRIFLSFLLFYIRNHCYLLFSFIRYFIIPDSLTHR